MDLKKLGNLEKNKDLKNGRSEMKFIAAMDHSGGSTGSVLERYGVEYTEDTKMDLVHDMRLRMINSPNFIHKNIWAAILYKDSVDRGAVKELNSKGIEAFLKIDSGCENDGTLKVFNLNDMIMYALTHNCYGTKMRSIVKTEQILKTILDQQFEYAEKIYAEGLLPIVEPEVPIDHPKKAELEVILEDELYRSLQNFKGRCILKLTLPETPNLYASLIEHPSVDKVVGLSGGYTTNEACARLTKNSNMGASFSRGLSEGLFFNQTEEEFNKAISKNIKMISEASSA
jgi:fructose-bisphosphate aldolase class I